jgi:hypothetical protein
VISTEKLISDVLSERWPSFSTVLHLYDRFSEEENNKVIQTVISLLVYTTIDMIEAGELDVPSANLENDCELLFTNIFSSKALSLVRGRMYDTSNAKSIKFLF